MKAAGAMMAVLVLAGTAVADDQAAMVDAVNRHGVTFATARPIVVWGMWFPDPKCGAFVGNKKQARDSGEQKLLADCLAGLGLHMEHDVPVYEPGVAVYFMVTDGKLTGVVSEFSPDPTAPFVSQEVLRDHLGGSWPEIQPDAATRAAIAKDAEAFAAADVDACIDATGKIDRLDVKARAFPAYAKTVEAAARAWKIAPFKRAGKALRVCTAFQAVWPPGRAIIERHRVTLPGR